MADGNLWRDRNKVFVAGLPLHVDDDALYDKFKPFGEMHQSKVVYDQKTGRSRGFGFVTFCDYSHALDAVAQMNESHWAERTLNVRFLQPKTGSTVATKPPKVIGPRPDGCMTVYVGNLAYEITEAVLRKVFGTCGSIRAVRFAQHIQTQEFRGFGYVQFHDEQSCDAAIQLDGMVVMGRPMTIDYGTRDDGYAQARDELLQKLKKGMCHKFQTGQCTRGDACKFAHVRRDQDAEDVVPFAGVTRAAASPKAKMAKVARIPDAPVCINFQKENCKRGDTCTFQHLRGNQPCENVAGVEATLAKETCGENDGPVCQNYQKGKCRRGDACRYRHVAVLLEKEGDVKGPVRAALPVAAVAQVAICRNFQNSSCVRGTSCRLAHTEGVQAVSGTVVEQVSAYQKRFQSVCYNWQRIGSCQRGDKCSFQHDGTLVVQDGDANVKTKLKRGHKDKKRPRAETHDEEEEVDKKLKKCKKDKKERTHTHYATSD